ncbi:hypothetical protein MTR_5g044360 [Medicago truncatula]|uniref:Uncharacterized protein n=1 Tax=Medicago truncatula TaxID=3880 RepID=G7JWV0_MEDTR|nr:hypothetical protein MTR_5g044360 [Medicago truncatula]
MGDQPMMKAEVVAALTPALKDLSAEMEMLTTNLNNVANNNINYNNNNKRKNLNMRGEPIPVIRVRNNNHTIVMYRKSDDYNEFKIYDSKYRCLFCYNKDYFLTDLLRHASRIAGNSCKTIKDIKWIRKDSRKLPKVEVSPKLNLVLHDHIDESTWRFQRGSSKWRFGGAMQVKSKVKEESNTLEKN